MSWQDGKMYFPHLMGVGMAFAFFDAFGIGSNDCANSWSTAVNSKTVTLTQASIIASFTEFGGAVLVGSDVADTIRGKLIDLSLFKSNPGVFMLLMVCALIGSSFWVNLSSKYGFPVSTTHSIIGAIIGCGIAAFGPGVIYWGYNGDIGVSAIVASWFISPLIAASLGAAVYLITKFSILWWKGPRSFTIALWAAPGWFGFVAAIEAWLIVWKGSPRLNLAGINDGQVSAIFFGMFLGVGLLTAVFVVPWLRRKIWEGEDLKVWHLPAILCLPRQKTVANFDDSFKLTPQELADRKVAEMERAAKEPEPVDEVAALKMTIAGLPASVSSRVLDLETENSKLIKELAKTKKPMTKWELAKAELAMQQKDASLSLPYKAYLTIKFGLFAGTIPEIAEHDSHDPLIKETHERAEQWSPQTEQVFRFLQVLTSSVASFAHGSNDVANAIGPLAAIYYVYHEGVIPAKKSPVDLWILAYGGAGIVLGLWFYGFNVMRSLGNKITFHSPSRGFCMELGAAMTVLAASKAGFPVSTTHCITGATVGVGLCNGDIRAINWRQMAWIFSSWVVTLPIAGIISGLIFAFVANSPVLYYAKKA